MGKVRTIGTFNIPALLSVELTRDDMPVAGIDAWHDFGLHLRIGRYEIVATTGSLRAAIGQALDAASLTIKAQLARRREVCAIRR